jgi:peptidyl-prolyl cis-trans isomerase D
VGGTVQQATDLTMENTMLPNVGPEAKVVGAHLHFRLIKYLHQSKQRCLCCKKREYCKSASFKSHAAYVTKLKAQSASDANRVIPALKANAKIEDNRIDFSY